ncbi:MAG: hypothetical protein RMK18_06975 [Armatimonadota bacterium]|nr:hypothetical protein [Armatimonadota bacterium]MCX7777582.1 hypothetical protein [Armatimonadota bacterium]MDW8025591.1 hypothetical protein [Armatimonadota bacterium]
MRFSWCRDSKHSFKRADLKQPPHLSLNSAAWYGIALFSCLLIHATLSAINTQAQRVNYYTERLTNILRMRHESLHRILARTLSPEHAEIVAKQLGMRKATLKDCEFVMLASTKPDAKKTSVKSERSRPAITDARNILQHGADLSEIHRED